MVGTFRKRIKVLAKILFVAQKFSWNLTTASQLSIFPNLYTNNHFKPLNISRHMYIPTSVDLAGIYVATILTLTI